MTQIRTKDLMEVSRMVEFRKIVYVETDGNPENKDYKACVRGKEEFCIETKGYCDRTPGYERTVVESYTIPAEELEKFEEVAKEELDRALKEKEDIEVEIIHRPLGRCYGNCYYYGIDFEYVKGDWWKASVYRGSNTWGQWVDIGMTGHKTDAILYVTEEDIRKLIEDFAESPKTFDIDLFDFTSDMREHAEISVYDLWGIDEYIGVSEEDWKPEKDIIVEIYDSEDFKQFLARDKEMTDELRKEILKLVMDRRNLDEECEGDKEEIEKVKKALQEAKTVFEFLEWYSDNYW